MHTTFETDVWFGQKRSSDACPFSSMQTLPVRVGQPAEPPVETGSACSATLEQSHRKSHGRKIFLHRL